MKTLESPLDCKEIQPVNPKGNQSWIFIGRTEAGAETEAPILWTPDGKNCLIGKDPDAGKDWRQEEKGLTEDEMVGWHHQLDGREFEQTPRVGRGSLACCSPWGRKESDTTELLNWRHINQWILVYSQIRIIFIAVNLRKFSSPPRVCSNSCPLSWWCHPTISSSVSPFSSCLQSFPALGSFPINWLFTPGGQSIGASASASVLPFPEYSGLICFRIDWFDLLTVQRTLKNLLQHHNL